MMSEVERHRITAAGVVLDFEVDCGFLCDLAIEDNGRAISPMHRVPWWGSSPEGEMLPHLKRMQGDFFCAPFADGGGTAPIFHGWPANGRWRVAERAAGSASLTAELTHTVQGARVAKTVTLRDAHPFVYQSHLFEGGRGTISAANHAMVSLPGGGVLSFSPKAEYRTPPSAPEPDPARGRSALAYPATSSDPRAFPLESGETVDLTHYPFSPRHEEFVVGIEADVSPLGWTAVVRRGQGDVYLSLRDPRQLKMTMLWQSDGGRDYPPWSGRHRACLGVEEGYAPHMLALPGGLDLDGGLDVRNAIGAIAWPSESRVISVEADRNSLTVTGEDGAQRTVPFALAHILR